MHYVLDAVGKSITGAFMWNPLRRWREFRKAEKMLEQIGLNGGIVDATSQAITILARQNSAIASAQKAFATQKAVGDAAVKQEEDTVTYFVPYAFEYSQYHNGGKMGKGSGMGMVHVYGGIKTWDNIMGVAEFIKCNYVDRNLCNPKVVLTGIFEVARCKKTQTEQPALNPNNHSKNPSEP